MKNAIGSRKNVKVKDGKVVCVDVEVKAVCGVGNRVCVAGEKGILVFDVVPVGGKKVVIGQVA